MAPLDQQRQEAERLAEEADRLRANGSKQEAIAALRRAMLLYAELDRLAKAGDHDSPLPHCLRARICERCADWLAEAEQHAEAANIYQEASDLYGLSGGREAEEGAHRCAHKVLTCVAALRSRPHDRLYLLIAHYERQLRQLALQPGAEEAQADCCFHIAGIFQRRDRPQEAVARYQEALSLYALAPQTQTVLLACAECHHLMAGLMANTLGDLPGAARHYREAVALYTAHEPLTYGVQMSRGICVNALADVERRLEGLPRQIVNE
jgi:tetratricopeptide (TPR) repeat protein